MGLRDVVSWTSMISAYGMNGQGRDAVALFSDMLESGVVPDQIVFVSILSACSHSGRPGLVDEAYKFISQMTVKPSEQLWGALLSACQVYSNMSLGLVAADHLFQLVPEQAGYYVLLSNIYAKAEMGKRVHTFLVGDQSHPQTKEIYEELDVLVSKMKEAGYVPETNSALHDVEEEDKECHLAVHSEKLAIVFVIINTEPGTPIRITKSLRVCGDCHVASKHISKIT
ncbi:hypothetical protein IFM89_014735 [Coptis chinensis]|uniref:DYW domain-containing protein n=1 Tax=Coptis chinensis TaxID=261450 RepID=A0A835M5V2_9MAGN|nr:hypothetical protein IFM89_014735 [Coptis chinensis]